MILKHRDRELLRFEWTGARGVHLLSVNEAERKFLPIDMFGQVTDESLWKWLIRRVAPISRRRYHGFSCQDGWFALALARLGIGRLMMLEVLIDDDY